MTSMWTNPDRPHHHWLIVRPPWHPRVLFSTDPVTQFLHSILEEGNCHSESYRNKKSVLAQTIRNIQSIWRVKPPSDLTVSIHLLIQTFKASCRRRGRGRSAVRRPQIAASRRWPIWSRTKLSPSSLRRIRPTARLRERNESWSARNWPGARIWSGSDPSGLLLLWGMKDVLAKLPGHCDII